MCFQGETTAEHEHHWCVPVGVNFLEESLNRLSILTPDKYLTVC